MVMYRVGSGELALTAGALTVMLGLSVTVGSASATNAKRSSGSFTLTGAVVGKLKVGHTSCVISASQPNTEGITWHSVKLNIFGKSKTLSTVKVDIEPSKFGTTNTLDFKAVNVPVGTVGLSIGPSPSWIGDSGTVSTSEGGKIRVRQRKHDPSVDGQAAAWDRRHSGIVDRVLGSLPLHHLSYS